MPGIAETPVEINSRTAQEGIVSVPEACFEKCKQLAGLVGGAAISQIQGCYDAVICGEPEVDPRYRFPRHCPAVRAPFSFEGAAGVGPAVVGEGETQAWADRVDDNIAEFGSSNLGDAYVRIVHK